MITKILVATHGSALSRKAIDAAVDLARALGRADGRFHRRARLFVHERR